MTLSVYSLRKVLVHKAVVCIGMSLSGNFFQDPLIAQHTVPNADKQLTPATYASNGKTAFVVKPRIALSIITSILFFMLLFKLKQNIVGYYDGING